MKTYLSLERAAQLSGLSIEQLRLLCEAGRLNCKESGDETNGGWFVAEDELVETLAAMNRELVLTEINELVQARHGRQHLTSTHEQGAALRHAAGGTLAIMLVALGVMGLTLHLGSPTGAQVATPVVAKEQLLPLTTSDIIKQNLSAALIQARARLQSNLHALSGQH